MPFIDESDMKRYLLLTNTLSATFERSYKLSLSYQLKQFVNGVQICTSVTSFCIIRARCLPLLSTDNDNIKLMHVDKVTRQLFGRYCSCTVGYKYSDLCRKFRLASAFRVLQIVTVFCCQYTFIWYLIVFISILLYTFFSENVKANVGLNFGVLSFITV